MHTRMHTHTHAYTNTGWNLKMFEMYQGISKIIEVPVF